MTDKRHTSRNDDSFHCYGDDEVENLEDLVEAVVDMVSNAADKITSCLDEIINISQTLA